MTEPRMIVYVCYHCRKLIGTRENFYRERRRVKGRFAVVAVCEGCHVKQ